MNVSIDQMGDMSKRPFLKYKTLVVSVIDEEPQGDIRRVWYPFLVQTRVTNSLVEYNNDRFSLNASQHKH